jgi:hypothetical protein
MSGPPDGKYQIQLAANPRPLIGVYPGPALEKPVIVGGVNNVWNVVRSENGNYILTLDDTGRPLFMLDVNGQLVGSSKPQPPLLWNIRRQLDGSYTIEVPSDFFPTRGWTVNDPEQQLPVYISTIEIPRANQQWNFIRLLGPE